MSKFSKKYKQWRKRAENISPRTRLVITIATVAVVLFGLVVVLLFIASQKKIDEETGASPSQKAQRDANVKQAQREGAIRDSAEDAIDKGDVAKANEVYDTAVKAEDDTAKKIQLYIDQSGVLYTAGKYTEAFEAAKKGEALSDDKFLAADWLSRIYEDQRQYADAATYYTLAGKWATSPMNKTKLTKNYYDNQAARVSALVSNS